MTRSHDHVCDWCSLFTRSASKLPPLSLDWPPQQCINLSLTMSLSITHYLVWDHGTKGMNDMCQHVKDIYKVISSLDYINRIWYHINRIIRTLYLKTIVLIYLRISMCLVCMIKNPQKIMSDIDRVIWFIMSEWTWHARPSDSHDMSIQICLTRYNWSPPDNHVVCCLYQAPL